VSVAPALSEVVVLIISHTYRVQRATERLFSNLRAIKPTPLQDELPWRKWSE